MAGVRHLALHARGPRPVGEILAEAPKAADPKPITPAPVFAAIPEELKRLAQWVLWKWELNDKGKWTKVPHKATGGKASTTKRATWTTFERAVAAYLKDGFDGIGFVFAEDDPYCGADLDKCRDPATGAIDPKARDWIQTFGTYAEISPSGTGVHLIARGRVPEGRKTDEGEVYCKERFFTVTGEHLDGTPNTVEPGGGAIEAFWRHLTELQGRKPNGNGAGGEVHWDQGAAPDLIRDKLAELLRTDARFRRAWDHEQGAVGAVADDSLSAWDLSLCSLAAARGWTDTELALLIRAHREAHGSDKWRRADYVERTLRRARSGQAEAEPGDGATDPETSGDPIAALNRDFALVLIGDKAAILYQTLDTEGRPENRFLSLDGFKAWLTNRKVQVGEDKVPLVRLWLASPRRRQYRGVVFAPCRECPGYFNLWRGFAVEPSEGGDCSLFLEHLRENVCQGDKKLFRWVFGWLAQMFQQPDRRPGTSLAIRGGQGTGKTKIGEVIGSLLGLHYLLAETPEQVVGKFNAHMAALLMLHADEAFFAGDPKSTGRLKGLVTSTHNNIEAKGRDLIRVRNYIRLLITSNENWVVPAGLDERRFCVLDMGTGRQKQHKFFAAMDKQLDEGGRAKLLHLLLTFDLSAVNLREIPDTEALREQKIASLSPERAWWLDRLAEGRPAAGHDDWAEPVPCRAIYASYIAHCERTHVRHPMSETALGIQLKRHLAKGVVRRRGPVTETDGDGYKSKSRDWVYEFPALADCRQAFERASGGPIEWDNEGDDQEEDAAS